MARYQLEIATEADDADLRTILRQTPMEGQISVAFQREPSYFAATVVEGDFHQVVAARDQHTHRLIGFGARNVRTLYVNGREQSVGYLSTLRLLKAHRNLGLIVRGYSLFRKLHEDGRAPFYLTTIAAGNDLALRILTSGRAGLPQYHYLEDLSTFAVSLRSFRKVAGPSDITVQPLSSDSLPEVLAFWQRDGRQRQFFPHLESHRLFSPQATYRDLAMKDIQVARRQDRVVGTFACWDQTSFRQSVVQRYSSGLAWSRPFYNAFAAVSGRPQLPPVGDLLRYSLGALLCVENFDAEITCAMVSNAARNAPSDAADFLLIGAVKSDPLFDYWQRRSLVTYTTHIYLVAWGDAERHARDLQRRPLYLELGCL